MTRVISPVLLEVCCNVGGVMVRGVGYDVLNTITLTFDLLKISYNYFCLVHATSMIGFVVSLFGGLRRFLSNNALIETIPTELASMTSMLSL